MQIALAQWLISKGRITHDNVYTGGGAVVRWAIDRLDLDGDRGHAALREFRLSAPTRPPPWSISSGWRA